MGKKPLLVDDDESDDNNGSGRKRRHSNISSVDRPSRKCSRNPIVEEDEYQDNEEKIPFRKPNRKSLNSSEELKSNDEPPIEKKLKSVEADSEPEEMAPLAISD